MAQFPIDDEEIWELQKAVERIIRTNEELTAQTEVLSKELATIKIQKQTLISQVLELQKNHKIEKKKNIQLEKEIKSENFSKIVSKLTISDTVGLKEKIDNFVKGIDYCVAMLNAQPSNKNK